MYLKPSDFVIEKLIENLKYQALDFGNSKHQAD